MPDERVIKAVERVIVGGVAITARALGQEAAELTLMQWRVLLVVGDEEAGVHVGTVGQRIGTSPPSASRIIRRLEDRGLVELVRDQADRRFMLVRLTRPGPDDPHRAHRASTVPHPGGVRTDGRHAPDRPRGRPRGHRLGLSAGA